MVQQGHELLGNAVTLAHQTRAAIEQIGGLHVHGEAGFYGPGRATELDPLQIIIDITALGVDGYHAADWLRDQHHIDLHVSDHRRVSAQLSYADSEQTATRLVHALTDLVHCASELPPAAKVTVPSPEDLRLELVHTPRNAFFARRNGSRSARPPRTSPRRCSSRIRPGSRRRAGRTAHRIGAGLPAQRCPGRDGDPRCRRPSLDSVRVMLG
jgi:hypothetical protein